MLQLRDKNSSKGPLWLVEQKYTIGSASDCDINVTGPAVRPNHAELMITGDEVEIINLIGGNSMGVNGAPVPDRQKLSPGDVIRIGSSDFELVDPKATAPSGRPKEEVQGWALKALNTALADKQFPLSGTQVIGRSSECDVSLAVVHLSRKHARVAVTDRGLSIQDLNSSNGTYVNGKKVSQAVVVAGDEISFDTLRFRVLGPVIDDDKTSLRTPGESNITTVRPALKVPEPQKEKVSTTSNKAKSKPRTSPASSRLAETSPSMSVADEKAQETGAFSLVWVGVILAIVGVIAWLFLR